MCFTLFYLEHRKHRSKRSHLNLLFRLCCHLVPHSHRCVFAYQMKSRNSRILLNVKMKAANITWQLKLPSTLSVVFKMIFSCCLLFLQVCALNVGRRTLAVSSGLGKSLEMLIYHPDVAIHDISLGKRDSRKRFIRLQGGPSRTASSSF